MDVAYVLGTTAGGTGQHVAMLVDGCLAAGVAATVYGPAGAGARFFADAAGRGGAGAPAGRGGAGPGALAFWPVDIADRPRPARDVAAVLRLRGLLRQRRHDVVHAHGLRAGALAALALAGSRRRPPLLVTVHNAPPGAGASGLVYRVLERIVARRADAVACVSSDLAARMGALGARDGGRAVVPAPPAAPPSPDAVAAVRAELCDGRRPLALAAGRLAAQKGFDALITAAACWQDRDPAPLVALAGDGPLEASLRDQAGRRGVAVRFLGRRDDVPALIAAADLLVVPSRWEGQPLIVQEALRAGRPIVAFRVGGIADLTGEDGALLVPPGDAGRLASAVLAVLDDADLAARLGAAARARAARLPTAADAAAAALAAYQGLVRTGPR